MILHNLVGQRFGRLTATERGPNAKDRHARWWCRCACGERPLVLARHLRHGETRSCGCLRREMAVTHGMARVGNRHPLYRTWGDMIQRCANAKHHDFSHYGGRSIGVCDRWRHDFPAFLADMGPKPSPEHSLDRIDNDGNYEPGNCRWATPKEQAANRRHPEEPQP